MNIHNTEITIIRNDIRVFGNGDHESTQMVLEALYQENPRGKSVLDVGTGTGIQSIFAKKWGATDILAVDIDAACIYTARNNFKKNDVEVMSRLNIYNEFIDEKYDITIANLTTGAVVEFLPMAKKTMSDNGVLIVSWSKNFGIHETHMEELGYEIVKRYEGIEWDAYVVRSAR